MEQFALYLFLKSIVNSIDDSIKCTFNDMDFNKPNSCGIYIKGSEQSSYRDIATGHYFNYGARVQFLLQGANSEDSLFNILNVASKIRDTLVLSCNKLYDIDTKVHMMQDGTIIIDNESTEDNISVRIILIHLLGEVDFKGKTTQGLPKYSINFKILYNVERRK